MDRSSSSTDASDGRAPSILSNTSRTSAVKSPVRKCADLMLWFLLDQWFLVILGILIIIASQVQVPRSQQAEKQLVIDYLAVSLIFFINGCTLPTRVLIENLSRWQTHLFVQVQSYLMASAVTFGIVSAAATSKNFMDPGLLIGMLILSCLPTTIAFNVRMTRKSHGNEALTVVQSTIGNFLGPFISPVLINMYISPGTWYTKILPRESGGYGAIYKRVFKQLGLSVFLPIVVGQLVLNIAPKPTKKLFIDWKLSKLGSIALLIIIWQTFDEAFSSGAFQSVKPSNIIFVVFISFALFFIWLMVCFLTSILWLPRKDTIAVICCVPTKTPAMGVPLTAVMFVGLSAVTAAKLRIPMVIFQGIQVLLSSLLTIPFRNWVDRNKDSDDERAAEPSEKHHKAADRSQKDGIPCNSEVG